MTGDELAALLAAGPVQLLDVRSSEEYDGSSGYGCDPVQGHIPGAVNIDLADLMHAGSEVRSLLTERGFDTNDRIVCYCHSGGRSAHASALLTAMGMRSVNYEGSWHEWSRRGATPDPS